MRKENDMAKNLLLEYSEKLACEIAALYFPPYTPSIEDEILGLKFANYPSISPAIRNSLKKASNRSLRLFDFLLSCEPLCLGVAYTEVDDGIDLRAFLDHETRNE